MDGAGGEGATPAAREETRKEDVLKMLRALVEGFRRSVQPRQLKELQAEEAERLERLRAEQGSLTRWRHHEGCRLFGPLRSLIEFCRMCIECHSGKQRAGEAGASWACS